MTSLSRAIWGLLPLLAGCGAPAVKPTPVTALTAADPASMGAPKTPLVWADLTPATLARAKAERRFVVLDGSAEWCHFCHVMEAETYHDPEVAEILARSFIAVKVDVDARPDIEERYGAWGWPATVLFSPDAEELGKYRGYIPAKEFAAILRDVVRAGGSAEASPHPTLTPLSPASGPLSEEALAWIERHVELDLDDYYDDDEGGWGRSQKAPIADDNAWALLRARGGDRVMRERVLFTLDKQRAVMDPVWGGIYQYSVGRDWTHAHFEKLMPYQAGALENYAEAFALTGDPRQLQVARSIRGYVDGFLTSKEGGFYATQDADLNAHEPGKPFVTGHDYYAMDDAHRRGLGVPRVDTHEYGKDNGLAIAAFVSLYEATCSKGPAACDRTALATAERAAGRILATHLSARGGVSHDAGADAPVLHLADNAAFGRALVRLYEATHDPTYLERARGVLAFMKRELLDAESGGFFASTADPGAVGVFARRRVPFEDNVMALRFLARLAKAAPGGDERPLIDGVLRAVAKPEAIKGEGRMIGGFLLALEETRGVRGAR